MSFVIAIDGPAGSGKGTIAELISKELGFINIDTGATFRCVTLAMLEEQIDIDDDEKIEELLENIDIRFEEDKDTKKVFLNNKDVTKEIREKRVNDFVSPVSTLKIVRENLLYLQRKMAEGKNVVMEGRDIGTTVFPNADVKIYLVASAEVRAKRRVKQLEEKGIKCTYEEALENVITRDKIDSSRELSPLKQAEDAICIDSSNKTIKEVVNEVLEIVSQKEKRK